MAIFFFGRGRSFRRGSNGPLSDRLFGAFALFPGDGLALDVTANVVTCIYAFLPDTYESQSHLLTLYLDRKKNECGACEHRVGGNVLRQWPRGNATAPSQNHRERIRARNHRDLSRRPT